MTEENVTMNFKVSSALRDKLAYIKVRESCKDYPAVLDGLVQLYEEDFNITIPTGANLKKKQETQ